MFGMMSCDVLRCGLALDLPSHTLTQLDSSAGAIFHSWGRANSRDP